MVKPGRLLIAAFFTAFFPLATNTNSYLFLFVLLPAKRPFYLSYVQSIQLYQPNKIDKWIEYPNQWDELETKELQAVVKVMISDIDNLQRAQSIICLEILKYRSKKAGIPIDIIQRIDPEDLALNYDVMVDFLFKDLTLTKQPYQILQLYKIPWLKIKSFTAKALKSGFEDITAGEFEACEIPFLLFKTQPVLEHLATIAAILYRPAEEPFLKYNAATASYTTYNYQDKKKYFEKLPIDQLFSIYLWYTGCRSMLPKIFPTMHEGDSNTQTDLMIFTKCIHAAAGPKNGTRDQVRCTLLLALFFEMEQEAIKAKELKELYERN